ncbi:hypothetical protein BpHYR1_043275 [Brachionus plicatilis]|uniref:Uncharacterized protein n=1 Tax=Brachionus plicatilis TaxID=10195 RepID=A0A3M7STQ7_BRAPC|nr:hypothetical protein BpHYR1_043275 [Brachionus plicatilis]
MHCASAFTRLSWNFMSQDQLMIFFYEFPVSKALFRKLKDGLRIWTKGGSARTQGTFYLTRKNQKDKKYNATTSISKIKLKIIKQSIRGILFHVYIIRTTSTSTTSRAFSICLEPFHHMTQVSSVTASIAPCVQTNIRMHFFYNPYIFEYRALLLNINFLSLS